MSDDGRRWLDQATHDLGTAWFLTEHARGPETACFLAQQSAEKALKGLLYSGGADVVLGHSVARLCRDVASLHPELGQDCARWATLDQLYITTRYPDALPGGTPAEIYTTAQARDACALAGEVIEAVRHRIG